jgi:hypothetical protein
VESCRGRAFRGGIRCGDSVPPAAKLGPTEALTANARFRVEVQHPSTVHDVALKAIERWRRSPATSPKKFIAKRKAAGDAAG